jgi:hypothetical protein
VLKKKKKKMLFATLTFNVVNFLRQIVGSCILSQLFRHDSLLFYVLWFDSRLPPHLLWNYSLLLAVTRLTLTQVKSPQLVFLS